jgi:BNR/Asp-box repeat
MSEAAVGPNRRVSGAQTTPRSESDIRINVGRPDRVIAAANSIGSGSGGQAQFSSLDGGITWRQTTLPLLSGDNRHADPTVGWTSDGTAWAITIGISGATLRLRAHRSTDGGATWSFDGIASGSQTDADKELMWVDRSPTSPFANNIYVIWHAGPPAFVNRRTGPTGAWQTPVRVSGLETTGTAIGGDITTNAAGDVFAFWPDTGSRRLLVAKSTNGGVTFRPPVVIATTFAAYDIGVPAFASRRALIYLSGAAYRDAADNFVYAVWTDLTGASGCTSSANEPGSNIASACKTRIWFARSTDGGMTWQRPTMINNQASRNDQFNPRMAVDDTDGTLVVVYYDTVGDPGRRKTDLWYQSSPDYGTTWTTPVKVTSAQTDETSAGADGNQYGDYNGLSGYVGTFFPSWTDRRGGGREEIWTAELTPDSVTDYVLMSMISQP